MRCLPLLALLTAPMLLAQQPSNPMLGHWHEPGGATMGVESCGADLCITLEQLQPHPPAEVDHNNPDERLRKRPLCGLRVGEGFHLVDPDHARDGHLYDPRTGKTYHGEMTAKGRDKLSLRGYIGTPLLGRSETWTRTSAPPPCAAHS